MTRPSARPKIITAALTVVEKEGISGLTLDAVATYTGITKRGLIYHFPNKQALLLGIHQHLAHNFDLALQKATGPDAEKASLLERTRAYVKASLASPHTVSLQLVLEATQEPDLLAPWAEVYQKWFPEEKKPVTQLDQLELACLTARMAADGAWNYEGIQVTALQEEDRAKLTQSILEQLDQTLKNKP